MRAFAYERADTAAQAVRLGKGSGQGQSDAETQFLSGGTTLIDLMKLDIIRPQRIIDIGSLHHAYAAVDLDSNGLRLGAFSTMAAVAEHPGVQKSYPVIAQSLQLAASAQLRNMATLGGNVLQKTRCTYYRDRSWSACNKRDPGSGCSAIDGFNRNHAVLGVDSSCISQYPGDFAVALIALDAQVQLSGPQGTRLLSFSSLHLPASGRPHVETSLQSGEIITGFLIPSGAWNSRSLYLKVRDRASYEFAIASAAVALELEGDVVRTARIGLGGMAYRPWRAVEAEQILVGEPLTEANAQRAAAVALQGAKTHGHNDYKLQLGRRTVVRALLQARDMPATVVG